jgi:hypothetical protein
MCNGKSKTRHPGGLDKPIEYELNTMYSAYHSRACPHPAS